MSKYLNGISGIIEPERDKFIHISNALWDFAETRFEEFQSADLLYRALQEEGFRVERGVANIDTAFVASFGTGSPIVGILGEYDASELDLAREFAGTLPDGAKAYELRFLRGMGTEGLQLYEHLLGVDLADAISPYHPSNYVAPASTDVGDVSWIVPTAQIYTACWVLGTPAHTWQVVSQGTTSIAHKGMLHAAKVLAAATLEIMQRSDIISEAREELKQRLAGDTYVCPIPPDVKPPHISAQCKGVKK